MAVVHISFNLIGTVVFLVLFFGTDLFFHFPFMDMGIDPVGIAMVHSIFNIATTLLLLPFSKQLVKIANVVIKDQAGDQKFTFVDSRLLATPSVAIAECNNKAVEMAQIAKETIIKALSLLDNYDQNVASEVKVNEDKLDLYEDKLGTTLVQLSSKALSDPDSRKVSKQLHTIGDFERIGDHAVNLWKAAEEIHEKGIRFSPQAEDEIHTLTSALKEILDITTKAFSLDDLRIAKQVEPLEQVIDCLIADIKSNHIARLQSGHCTIEMGFVLSDILTNCERVSDHCSNIAVAQIETEQNTYQAHEYLNGVKNAGNEDFQQAFDRYRAQYRLEGQADA